MKIFRCIMALFVIIGIGFFLYPTVATFVADYTSTKVVVDYDKQLEALKQAEMEKRNESHKDITLDFGNKDFREILKNNKKKKPAKPKKEKPLRELKTEYKKGEWIGNVIIDKVDIYLPLYVGTHESVLLKGAGHLEGTSLPIGGKGTHAVVTSHSGMATASLFSRLNELEKGDTFVIEFLDEELLYRVDRIVSIEPDESDPYITKEPDKDYLTLITCVPETVNTHRLLVRGHRIPNEQKNPTESVSEQIQGRQTQYEMMFAIIAALIISILLTITSVNRRKNKKKSI